MVLWRALPVRGGTDPEGVLEDYQFALQDCSALAVENTVNALRAGKIEEASKDFCPKAPKLAEYARAEQRRLDAINRPPAVEHKPARSPEWIGPERLRQMERDSLSRRGFLLFAENISQDSFAMSCGRRKWPVGSTWKWLLQEVWAPSVAAEPPAYRRKIATDMPDDERQEAAE